MVRRIGTTQTGTRFKFKRHYREKGKLSLSKYFQEFDKGDKVNLIVNPYVQVGRFFPRFYGLTGTISGKKKGACYEVLIRDGGKEKLLYIHPIHLVKQVLKSQ